MSEPQLVAIPSTLRWTGDPDVYTPERPDWQARGACIGADPDLFFPERGEETRRAKQVCAACPVRQECLDYAIANAEKFGIWGGKSEGERRAMRSGTRRRPAGPQRELAQRMASRGAAPSAIAAELGITTRSVHRYLIEDAS